jgi:two-component system response regulator DegU
MIRLIVVMDREHELRRTTGTLNSNPEFSLIGSGADGYQALKLSEIEQPDIAVIGYHLDGARGPDLIPAMKRKCPATGIILISPSDDENGVQDALMMGVSGYLIRKSDMDMLADAIRMVYAGGCYISHRIVVRAFQSLKMNFPQSHLFHQEDALRQAQTEVVFFSLAERRIFGFIGQGRTTKEIAETMSLKIGTIRNYISGLMQKTGLHTRTQMFYFAVHNSLDALEPAAAPVLNMMAAPALNMMAAPALNPIAEKIKLAPLLEARRNLETASLPGLKPDSHIRFSMDK